MDYTSDAPFGFPISVIQSGRSRYGLFVDHNPSDDNKVAMSSEAGVVCSQVFSTVCTILMRIQVYVFDLQKGETISSWASHAMPVRSFGWSGDGNVSAFLPFPS
jgi:WD repeat-containing protein 61